MPVTKTPSTSPPSPAAVAVAVPLLLVNRAILGLGLRQRPDGWRRGSGLVLRGEASTFVLSAFGLRASPATESNIAAQLAEFLAKERGLFICIQRGAGEDAPSRCDGPSYTLGFQPWVDGPARFIRPDDWTGSKCFTHTHDPLFNFICRVSSEGEVDVWLRVNHIGTDGVPAQELMSRLEASWGIAKEVVFPTPDEFMPFHLTRRCNGRDELAEVQAFIDFAPLLAWRKEQNAKLSEAMTLSAAFLWKLGRSERFKSMRMGTTVELPQMDHLARGVSVVVTRPADFANDTDGLTRYVKQFNRDMELNRTRQSTAMKMIDAIALLPTPLASAMLRQGLAGDKAFGSIALTVLRDAKVFGAPMGDYGHPDGFIALGSVGLKTRTGQKVGCMTVKGPPQRIADYPRTIQAAIADA